MSIHLPHRTRLIAADMDGTFLNDAKTFDRERFSAQLEQLDELGIRFVVASGNTYTKLLQYMEGFENRNLIYVAENGAYLADDSGQLAVHPFEPDSVPRVYEVLDSLPQIGALICTTEGVFMPVDREETVVNIIKDYFLSQDTPVPAGMTAYDFVSIFYPGTQMIDSYDQVHGAPIKFPLQTLREDTYPILEILQRDLPASVTAMASGFGAIDLVRTGANKGTGLLDLSERLNIAPESMVAFGDGENDIEMLKVAGTGVAMGHAPQSLREHAQLVIGSPNDGAVLDAIDEIITVERARGL
ncbi:MAG: Cof-type HAD-IIB family hydrolase [Rothia sp. (in: high G+C Gram-positive bacteria)]|uniref:Cof-type HAD-IIB family hydrolase n=1 Tax=Rothia sp. (in: high G+C Gram-positive bacteria) TaxID=1885016 RepID=UPI0026E03478|nr:Cof-type HAD-IIB family hydrolase [Rothia sp. (in: high G+C Gram-positive bacteria)]MDO5750260.1 Cof-type HAD-IIB family hydrolase [Rothia sp. (in: high G+C Gram-positive bacteria)]